MCPIINNVLTIDVEDYFHVSAFANFIDRKNWDDLSPRLEGNIYRLLDLFEERQVKATYFVLGWVAERFPHLIREIDSRGHEIASHGYSHQLVYLQTPTSFEDETKRSKNLLEDIIGKSVWGYRAASYSITRKSLWALDILAEQGFKYDSSIFPVLHDRYGIRGSPDYPHILETPKRNTIVEYPLSTFRLMGVQIPIAGGGYFRLYPYWLSRFFYRKVNESSAPFVFYLHPWEIDPEQPRVQSSVLSSFRHYNNLEKTQGRLSRLLSDFSFTTMYTKLEDLNMFSDANTVAVRY